MASFDKTETVGSFDHDGKTYEVDDLGICVPNQGGTYAIYCAGEQVGEFSATEGDDYDTDALIELARQELATTPPLPAREETP